MIVKWIQCEVPEELKEKFSDAQEKWAELKNMPGFVGQVGGWDAIYPERAYIIAFWENEESVDNFMKTRHDKMIEDSGQENTYEKLSINYFVSQTELEGESGNLFDAVDNSFFLRVADCVVRSDGAKHFENVQKSVWLPGFKKAPGMQGGLFSKGQGDQNRYLLSVFWNYKDSNDSFEKQDLLSLRKIAAVNEDILSLDIHLVNLEESWKVVKLEKALQ